MKFERLHAIILESFFDKLPKEKPYGFWITPIGEYIQSGHHYRTALKIIENNPTLAKAYKAEHPKGKIHPDEEEDFVISFLIKNHFIRTRIRDGFHFYMDITGQMNSAQRRTIKDIAAFYQIQPKNGLE
jgi:hypothetical protein